MPVWANRASHRRGRSPAATTSNEFPDVFFDDPVRSGPPGRHDGGRSERHRSDPRRPHRLLAQPRLRPLRPADHAWPTRRCWTATSTRGGCSSPTSTAPAAPTWCTSRPDVCTSGSTGPATPGASRQTITGTPSTDDATALQFADVFGTGTATLVWSRDLDRVGHEQLPGARLLRWGEAVRPRRPGQQHGRNHPGHLRPLHPVLPRRTERPANRGSPRCRSRCRSWTRWRSIDHVGQTKRVATYRYHHGHYDGREREFCGFGRVDQFDTESFEDFSQTDPSGDAPPVTNGDRAHYVPPVETRSWFHTGVYFDEAGAARRQPLDYRDLTARFRQEYYSGGRPGRAARRARRRDRRDAGRGVPGPARRSAAHRGLRPRRRRTADHPYQVSESRYRVAQLQPRSGDHHAVHFSHQVETADLPLRAQPGRSSHQPRADAGRRCLRQPAQDHERRLRTSPDQTRACRPRPTATGRHARSSRSPRPDSPTPSTTHAADAYRAPAPSETLTHELTGFEPLAPDAQRFTLRRMGGRRLRGIDGRAGHRLRGGSRSGRPAEAPDRADQDASTARTT